jgi:hypothetical protein
VTAVEPAVADSGTRGNLRWFRAAGAAAIVAAPLGWIAVASGFALSGDGPGPEHRLHWLSHLLDAPAALAAAAALIGVGLLERGLGRIGRAAIVVAVLAGVVGAVGGVLVGWAGGVQDSTSGGLYDLGHGVGDVGALGLPAGLVLSVVVIVRARVLPTWSGWIPFAALPVAAVAGVVLGAAGRDGGTAFVLFLAAPGVQLLVWGRAMLAAAQPAGQGSTTDGVGPPVPARLR